MAFDKDGFLAMFPPNIIPVAYEFEGKHATVFVRELSARQIFALQDARKKAETSGTNATQQFALLMVSEALCDEDGKRIYSLSEAQRLLDFKMQAFNKLAEIVGDAIGLGTKVEPGKDLPAGQNENSSIV